MAVYRGHFTSGLKGGSIVSLHVFLSQTAMAVLVRAGPLAISSPSRHTTWVSPELSWNTARLGLFATEPDVPVEGTGYEHPGDFFPSDIFVCFGVLRLDPASWHEDIGHAPNGHLFPILLACPAAA